VGLEVVGDEFFFSILPKFLDWEIVLCNLGDALTKAAYPPMAIWHALDTSLQDANFP